MISRLFSVFIIALFALPVTGETAQILYSAEQYIGAGLARFSINSNHPSIDDQSISGMTVIYGIRSNNHAFELGVGGGGGVDVGPTYDIYYPEDTADYTYLSLSYHYQFRTSLHASSKIVPYVGGGYSFNSINWNNYVYDSSGDGYKIEGGIIMPLAKTWSVNLGLIRHRYSGSRIMFSSGGYDNYTTHVNELSVNAVYHFLANGN